ncbi:MAG: hypothetical protein IJD42_06015 [Clostridia bacterium]|nr:hypothetical protein [Clostridia bacterium]
MFAKLLKHDLRSLSRVGKPLAIGSFILGILGLISSIGHSLIMTQSYKIIERSAEAYANGDFELSESLSDLYSTLSFGGTVLAFMMFFIFMLLCASCLTIMVLLAVNFYKTLITDEGYLTFTLPVAPSQILLSKIVNAIIWNAIIMALFALGTAMLVIPSVTINENGLLAVMLSLEGYNKMNLVLFIVLAIESSFFSVIAYQIFYFFAIFLGGIVAKKRKLLASAGIIVGGHVAYYILQQILSFGFIVVIYTYLTPETTDVWLPYNPIDPFIITNIPLLFSFLGSIVISVVFFFVTKRLMTKNLNLP